MNCYWSWTSLVTFRSHNGVLKPKHIETFELFLQFFVLSQMARQYENGFLNPTLSVSSKDLANRRSNTSLNVIENRLYDEAGSNSPYNTLQRNTNNTVKPRQQKGPDVVYDNVGPGSKDLREKRTLKPSHKHARQRRRRKDGVIRVVLMCLIVFVAAIAVLLAILLMMGKVGPSCSCDNSGKHLFIIS